MKYDDLVILTLSKPKINVHCLYAQIILYFFSEKTKIILNRKTRLDKYFFKKKYMTLNSSLAEKYIGEGINSST